MNYKEQLDIATRKLALIDQGEFNQRMYKAGIEQSKELNTARLVILELIESLEFHQEQTRPIESTKNALVLAKEWLDSTSVKDVE